MSRLFLFFTHGWGLIHVKNGRCDVTLSPKRSLKHKKSRKMLDFLAECINFAD